MKIGSLLCLLILFSALSCRKEIVDEKTTNSAFRIIGGAGLDIPNRMISTRDGGYAICGFTKSFNGGTQNAHLIKLDKNLNLQWQRNYGGFAMDKADDIRETKDGGFLLVCLSQNGGIDPSTGKNFDKTHPLLIKTDHAGNVEWESHLRMSIGTWDIIFKILEEDENTFTFLGQAWIKTSTQATIIKTDKKGNLLSFTKNVVGKTFSICTNATKTTDNTYVGSGFMGDGSNMNFSFFKFNEKDSVIAHKSYDKIPYDKMHSILTTLHALPGENFLLSGCAEKDVIIVKADKNGNEAWKKRISLNGLDAVMNYVKINKGGDIFIMGQTSYSMHDMRMFLIKLDAEGNKIFDKIILPEITSTALDFKLEDNGEITVFGFVAKAVNENSDFVVFRLNKKGDIIYE